MHSLKRSEESVRYPGTEVSDVCELLNIGMGEPRSSAREVMVFNP